MPTRNLELTEHFDQYTESVVASGRCENASEIIREGLQLLETRARCDVDRLTWLRDAVQEGADEIDNGNGIELLSMEQSDAFIDQIAREVSAELASGRKPA